MIELRKDRNDHLFFSFPEVSPDVSLRVEFNQTLRTPDDGNTYRLPPHFGALPLRHVDDFPQKAPLDWLRDGGVMLALYQSDAMWLRFQAQYVSERDTHYPLAVRVATGKINAITGSGWTSALQCEPQDYLVVPGQTWLQGYCPRTGLVRQFVAAPLEAGSKTDEQTIGETDHGGLQLQVCPMKRDVFERRFPKIDPKLQFPTYGAKLLSQMKPGVVHSTATESGLPADGKKTLDIYDDPFDLSDWDVEHSSSCFVHIANSLLWRLITDSEPTTRASTAETYAGYEIPWFDHYKDRLTSAAMTSTLSKLKSAFTLGFEKDESSLPEKTIDYHAGLQPNQVRECPRQME